MPANSFHTAPRTLSGIPLSQCFRILGLFRIEASQFFMKFNHLIVCFCSFAASLRFRLRLLLSWVRDCVLMMNPRLFTFAFGLECAPPPSAADPADFDTVDTDRFGILLSS